MSALQIILGVFVDHLFYLIIVVVLFWKPFLPTLWCNCRWVRAIL